jgi:hypothetical protein
VKISSDNVVWYNVGKSYRRSLAKQRPNRLFTQYHKKGKLSTLG